jgi:hypothetical protein
MGMRRGQRKHYRQKEQYAKKHQPGDNLDRDAHRPPHISRKPNTEHGGRDEQYRDTNPTYKPPFDKKHSPGTFWCKRVMHLTLSCKVRYKML